MCTPLYLLGTCCFIEHPCGPCYYHYWALMFLVYVSFRVKRLNEKHRLRHLPAWRKFITTRFQETVFYATIKPIIFFLALYYSIYCTYAFAMPTKLECKNITSRHRQKVEMDNINKYINLKKKIIFFFNRLIATLIRMAFVYMLKNGIQIKEI